MNEELGFYDRLIENGCDIVDLLYRNSDNVGDIGDLLVLAAIEIKKLRCIAVSDKDYSRLREIGEYLHFEEYNEGARKDALDSYFDLYDSIFAKLKQGEDE